MIRRVRTLADLAEALRVARPGDEIVVEAGEYLLGRALEIPNGVNVRAEGVAWVQTAR